MARHRRSAAPEEDKPELSISPLIDVCFLLLIYFLVTTTIKQKERDNNMMLPSAAPSETPPPIDPFFIKINSQGHIYANVGPAEELLDREAVGKERNLPLLNQRLDVYAMAANQGNSKPLVQIFVEGEAEHQRVVDVMNLLAKFQIDSVTFTDLLAQDTEGQ